MLQGIGASAGIGIGKAVLLQTADLDYSHVTPASPAGEKARLIHAMECFTARTTAMAEAMGEQVGAHQAEILMGQVMMISDPFMTGQMEELMDSGLCAEGALDAVCNQFADLFAGVDDELTRQRATDVRDLRDRLLRLLLGREELDLSSLPPDTVLVAHDLTPSMTAGLRRGSIAGILTEVGGTTSHSAILARAMELPAVLSVPGCTALIQRGDTVVVDGGAGTAFVRPDGALLADYTARREAFLADRAALQRFSGLPTHTADGQSVTLCCNIGSPRDAAAVLEATGEGVGLFRTEFLFMDRSALPTEEEQFEAYRAVAEAMEGREVIIRTLDVGGDKALPYLGLEREENPFLGFRAIRYCLERPDVFSAQLRALLRASVYGNLKIMLPMVSCLDELRRAKALLSTCKAELDGAGVPYDKALPVGVMIETPAAALMADLLSREADFFSIGTNDLTQYVMAADRGNQAVAPLCTPFQPAVLRAIRQIIAAGHGGGIPVGMCGEAAADPRLTPLLLAFGLDEFSVGPSAVLSTRKAIARWTLPDARRVAEEVMARATAEEVLACLTAHC